MATLILGTVGRIFGPIGGAIGALAGLAIDSTILKPKGREGPRLADLRLQTSSYGDPIAHVFGTMRVAGTVIWSTDLIEHRSTERHKGQPSQTSYSYSASFAVLLSARRVQGVGRIWADGNLLRGAAGDFKTPTGFRLHPGDEDQPPDPLIASLEGALTPAHRGCAYVVFENMQLADYGNRIPSLTFELIADAGAVGAGAIAEELAGGALVDAGVSTTLDGFSAYGATRDVIELLASASGARFTAAGGVLAMSDSADPVATLADAGFAAAGQRPRAKRQVAAMETVPRTLSVAHYDAARDYQAGVQQARRPGPGERALRIEMPAVMTAAAAKTLAEASLARAETAREQRRVSLAAEAAAIAPGSVVALAGEGGRWRVSEAALEAMVTELTLVRLANDAPAAVASPGRVLPTPDRVEGNTILIAAELPGLGETALAAPRLSVVAAGSAAGWRRAALLYSIDDGASWRDGGVTAAPSVIGTIIAPPGIAPATLIDMANAIEVELARDDMVLADADDAALDAGANLALAGDELLQFGRAERLSDARWRLTHLWRGRRGTEAAAGLQVAGDRFALIAPDGVAAIDLPVAAVGASVRVLASGTGDIDGPVEAVAVVAGASVRPLAPALLRIAAESDESAVRWARRSRLGFRWIDGGDVPLAEEAERYRVTIGPLAADLRTTIVTEPACALLPGEAVAGTAIEVRQIGALGESLPARITLT